MTKAIEAAARAIRESANKQDEAGWYDAAISAEILAEAAITAFLANTVRMLSRNEAPNA